MATVHETRDRSFTDLGWSLRTMLEQLLQLVVTSALSERTLQRPAWHRRAAVRLSNAEVLPQSFFEQLRYDKDLIQWDLFGQPQPCVRHAALTGAFGAKESAVLDCGCGAGDNAVFLAALGYDVLGFDVGASAVATARERSAADQASDAIASAHGHVEFVQASATALDEATRVQQRARELGGFAVALDSALIHCLDDDAQRAYVDGVRAVMRPGAHRVSPPQTHPSRSHAQCRHRERVTVRAVVVCTRRGVLGIRAHPSARTALLPSFLCEM
jgi:SAM-dependent methyltransferase